MMMFPAKAKAENALGFDTASVGGDVKGFFDKRVDESGLKADFPSYLLTPLENDKADGFDKALYAKDAPGRSVCMSVGKFIEAKTGYEQGKVYKAEPCINTGFSFSDFAIGFGVGGLLGFLAFEIVSH
jgi:hypothetical protein